MQYNTKLFPLFFFQYLPTNTKSTEPLDSHIQSPNEQSHRTLQLSDSLLTM